MAVSGLLAACGGGGSETRPEVTPPPPPVAPADPEPDPEPQPEPTEPESIHDLRQNHSFAALAASSLFKIDQGTGIVTADGSASDTDITVSYNAATKTYTLKAPGHTQTFGLADLDNATSESMEVYRIDRETGNDQLILLKTALDGVSTTKHVALGVWQRNSFLLGSTNAEFDAFVYGFEAPASVIPRSGTGSFSVDVFGLTASPGFEPRSFDGTGRFDVDFDHGIFSTYTELFERNIFTGETDSGTGFDLTGTGALSSSDGTFSGRITYRGIAGTLPGTMNGRFYGPDASEVGATFSATDGSGSTLSGGMVGWHVSDTPSRNLTLTNLAVPETFITDDAYMNPGDFQPLTGNGTFILEPDGSLQFTPSDSTTGHSTLSPETIVASADPNFTAYETSLSFGSNVRVELFKPGQANTELQLTYASFGQWQRAPAGTPLADGERMFFAYGLRTPEGALSARTGSAHYEGVAYGMALNTNTQARHDVTGTSRFDVDFSKQTFAGELTLAGKTASGTSPVDGTYQFGSSFDYMNRMNSIVRKDGAEAGMFQGGFYGPNGEEIAGSFGVHTTDAVTGDVFSVTGATVARQK